MALDATGIQLLLWASTTPIFLASAAFFAMASPASRASRLLAAFLLLLTARTVASFMETSAGTPREAVAWDAFGSSMNQLAFGALLVLFWYYPQKLTIRSWHGRAYAALLGLYAAYVLTWFAARDVFVGARGATLLYQASSIGVNVAITIAGVSALARARGLAPRQRRAADILVPILLLTTIRDVGYDAWGIAHELLGGPANYSAQPILLALSVALTLFGAGVVAYLTFWERSYAALALAVYGFFRMVLGFLTGTDVSIFALLLTLRPVVPLYLVTRYGLFDLPPPKRVASRILPLATGALVFLMVNASALMLFGDSALTVATGVFLGLALGTWAAIAVGPAHLGRVTTSLMGDRVAPLRGQTSLDAIEERYQAIRLLGEGAQGTTHLCRDLRLQRDVVVKRISGGAGGKALREARVVARLKHPNIIAIHDIIEDDHDGYIVMEHADGGNLRQRLPRGAGLSESEARRIAGAVLSALEACHAEGVVHCDIKPENILFDARGNVKLIDFGIARDPRAARTLGVNAGTLHYMSPEQVRGEKPDARTDVFSTGVVLHEMLTGKLHLRRPGASDFDVRSQIIEGAWTQERPRGTLGSVIQTALAPDPRDRFPSAGMMGEALLAARQSV